MGFLAVMLAYTIRTSLSLSITRMVVSHGQGASAEECVVEGDDKPGTSVSRNKKKEIRSFINFYCSVTNRGQGVILNGRKNYKVLFWLRFILGML